MRSIIGSLECGFPVLHFLQNKACWMLRRSFPTPMLSCSKLHYIYIYYMRKCYIS